MNPKKRSTLILILCITATAMMACCLLLWAETGAGDDGDDRDDAIAPDEVHEDEWRITGDEVRHNKVIELRDGCSIRTNGTLRPEDALVEAAKMAEDHGVVLALQNHTPIINNYRDMLDFVAEVDSPALKACLDAPLVTEHTEEHYRAAVEATGDLMVHSHFGGRYERTPDGEAVRVKDPLGRTGSDLPLFMKLAKEVASFQGHTGYELCSPVLINHQRAGLEYALLQAELAGQHMRGIIDSL